MRILITAADEQELITVKQACKSLSKNEQSELDLTWMLTGIGVVSTSYRLTKALNKTDKPYDLVLNAGIAGTFNERYPVGSVVRVVREFFGDLGFESHNGFQTLFDYNILDANTQPFVNGALIAPELEDNIERAISKYDKVTAVTVQTVSGLSEKRERMKREFTPAVESMEGAALFYVCLLEKQPFIELRSISNEVGERDKKKWDIPLALNSLRDACKILFEALAR